MPYKNIESWASRIGYVVEGEDGDYIWHKENSISHKRCSTIGEVIDQILEEIRSSYQGER